MLRTSSSYHIFSGLVCNTCRIPRQTSTRSGASATCLSLGQPVHSCSKLDNAILGERGLICLLGPIVLKGMLLLCRQASASGPDCTIRLDSGSLQQYQQSWLAPSAAAGIWIWRLRSAQQQTWTPLSSSNQTGRPAMPSTLGRAASSHAAVAISAINVPHM